MNINNKIITGILLLVLCFSVSCNVFLWNKISSLREFITATNPWVSEKEYALIKKEINRLSQENMNNVKYDIKTKERIKNLGE